MDPQKQCPSLAQRILDAQGRAEGQVPRNQPKPVPPYVRDLGEKHH